MLHVHQPLLLHAHLTHPGPAAALLPPQVAEAHDKLHAMFPEGGVDQMVEQQPLMLAADVDHTVGELER
jgi:hypothetical protein